MGDSTAQQQYSNYRLLFFPFSLEGIQVMKADVPLLTLLPAEQVKEPKWTQFTEESGPASVTLKRGTALMLEPMNVLRAPSDMRHVII